MSREQPDPSQGDSPPPGDSPPQRDSPPPPQPPKGPEGGEVPEKTPEAASALAEPATLLLPHPDSEDRPTTRTLLRIIATVLGIAGLLLLIRLLWQPLAWVLLAGFLAIALSGPVNLLERYMRRGLAIGVVYSSLLLMPLALIALIAPPLVSQGVDFANNLPHYAQDLQTQVNRNRQLQQINRDFGVTGKVQQLADHLPTQLGEAASTMRRVGSGLVSSIFAGFTILILSIFMVSRGRRWIDALIDFRGGKQADALKLATDRIAHAIGNYVAGAALQATVAGVSAWIVMTILGVPFAGALAVLVAVLDLIPMVGSLLAAVIVGVVTLFHDFPTDTVVWVVFAVAYQQFENYIVQPQIQKRAVQLDPFVVLVAVLFGGTLFGILGALLAIPVAAALQIAAQEWWRYRLETHPALQPEGPPRHAPE